MYLTPAFMNYNTKCKRRSKRTFIRGIKVKIGTGSVSNGAIFPGVLPERGVGKAAGAGRPRNNTEPSGKAG